MGEPNPITDRWEVGGPYPAVSVIYLVADGCGPPDPEPPVYEAICQLWPNDQGEAPGEVKRLAERIVQDHNDGLKARAPVGKTK